MRFSFVRVCLACALALGIAACGDDDDEDAGTDADTDADTDTDTDADADTDTDTGTEPDGGAGNWTCASSYYDGEDGCDCGCTIDDPDCGDAGCPEPGCEEEGCDFCYGPGGTDVGCGGAPGEWSCEESYYADGFSCDCGCGAADPDCGSGGCAEDGCTDAACNHCWDSATDESGCAPAGWACASTYYNEAGDFCDCGCGIADPDCGGDGCAEPFCDAESCDYCYDGSGALIECGTPAPDAGTGDAGAADGGAD